MTYRYHDAGTVAEALDLLARLGPATRPMAGATALVPNVRAGRVQLDQVVGLRRIASLRGIEALGDGAVRIGAGTTHTEVVRSPVVAELCPALVSAFAGIATIRVRNQATLGGNLAHADPAHDPPPMLLALGAEVEVVGPAGTRRIPIGALILGPFVTSLRSGELITAIHVPAAVRALDATWVKSLPDARVGYATVSVATAIRLDADGRCVDARIAVAAGSTPARVPAAEAAITGVAISSSAVAAAVEALDAAVVPVEDVRGTAAHKRQLLRTWLRRSLEHHGRQPMTGR